MLTNGELFVPPDGCELTNDHGYPVGHCTECRVIQVKMYYFDKQPYCINCFPKVVTLKNALKSLLNEKQI